MASKVSSADLSAV